MKFPALAFAALSALAPLPAAAQPAPPPEFDYRKQIADNLAKLFSPDAQVRNVAVSEMRRVPSPLGLVWAACVRVNATNMTGKPTLPRTYVVTFSRNAIADRRAISGEECAGAKFEPLS